MNWFERTFEISHSHNKSIRSMEGLRGFAVFLVFLVHYVVLIAPWMSAESALYQIIGTHLRNVGNAGVDLFFVLSGYLIYGTLMKKPKPFLPYIARRAQRIYPTFLAVFTIYLILSFLSPEHSKLPETVPDAAIYVVQNILLLPGFFAIKPIITVAWSLSYEVFFYLLIPILISSLVMRSWTLLMRVLFFLTISAGGFLFFYFHAGHIRLLMFVAGMLLFEIVDTRAIRAKSPIGLLALILAVGVMIVIKETDINAWWRFPALYIFFFLLCWDCFTSSGTTSRLFSWSPLRWYGNMSYSYYLIHGLSLKASFLFLKWIFPPRGQSDILFGFLLVPMFLTTLVPSTLLFVLIEKPFSLPKKRVVSETTSYAEQACS